MIYLRLTNAPASFMYQMNRVFQNYLYLFMIVSEDEILVYSKNEVNDMDHLRVIYKS